MALCVCSVIFLFSLGPKRPPVAIYGKFRRGGIEGTPFVRLQDTQAAPARFPSGPSEVQRTKCQVSTSSSLRVQRRGWPGQARPWRRATTLSRHVVSELCPRPRTKNRLASGNKEGSGAPRGACQPCQRLRRQVYAVCATHPLRGCALPCERRARLSALTLAALATGYYPDGSALEPGFPKTDFASVLPAWPACLRLSTLRADRSFCRPGTRSRPGADCIIPRAGTPLLRPSKVPSRKAPSLSRMSIRNIIGDECQRYPTTVS